MTVRKITARAAARQADRLSPVDRGDGEFPFTGDLDVVTFELIGGDLPGRAMRGAT